MDLAQRRSVITWFVLFALLPLCHPSLTLAESGGPALRGRVIDVTGKPAAGYTLHLIAADGSAVGQGSTALDGRFEVRDVSAGSYRIGIEHPSGAMAPVAGRPLALGDAPVSVGDIKLVQAGATQRNQVLKMNASLGSWWKTLPISGKVWVILGVAMGVGLTVEAFDDDEAAASPM